MQRQNCQERKEMVKAIRDAIQAGAKPLKKSGSIRISLVPYTVEADAWIDGISNKDDLGLFEYVFALNPSLEVMRHDVSDYTTICIKRKKLIGGQAAEGATEKVYAFSDYLDITVRVCGDERKNKALSMLAVDAIKPFFPEQSPDFSITVK